MGPLRNADASCNTSAFGERTSQLPGNAIDENCYHLLRGGDRHCFSSPVSKDAQWEKNRESAKINMKNSVGFVLY